MTKSKQLTAEQRAVLAAIWEGGTHAYYTVEFTHRIERAFGFEKGELVETVCANTGDPKGLFVEGARKNQPIQGCSSHYAAEAIARKLGVSYSEKFGRGSQQREALCAIASAYPEKVKDDVEL